MAITYSLIRNFASKLKLVQSSLPTGRITKFPNMESDTIRAFVPIKSQQQFFTNKIVTAFQGKNLNGDGTISIGTSFLNPKGIKYFNVPPNSKSFYMPINVIS